MCIAIVKPAGKRLTEETLRICFENNPDGAGYAYQTEHGLRIRKGFFKVDDFLEAYTQDKVDETNALVHFRITTRGDTSVENCHPFQLQHGALIHNGTISGLGSKGQGKSDTQLFADRLFKEDFATLRRLRPVFDALLDGNRVALMDVDGKFLVFNAHEWYDEDGVLFSNDGYLGYETTFIPGWTERPDRLFEPTSFDEVSNLEASQNGFQWENDTLYRVVDGELIHDKQTEDDAYAIWFEEYDNFPETEEERRQLNYITLSLIEEELAV